MHSDNKLVRQIASKKWKQLYDKQKDPEEKFFDTRKIEYRNIQLECPIWSHVRKANPKEADGVAKLNYQRRKLRPQYFFSGVINLRAESRIFRHPGAKLRLSQQRVFILMVNQIGS